MLPYLCFFQILSVLLFMVKKEIFEWIVRIHGL